MTLHEIIKGQQTDKVVVIKDGLETEIAPPKFGTVTITFQDGKPMYINVGDKIKL